MREWITKYGIDVFHEEAQARCEIPAAFTLEAAKEAQSFHAQIPGYCPTPLLRMESLERAFGVKAVLVKDESKRFSLNAFKGLGGSYAMFRILCDELKLDPKTTTLARLRSPEYAERIRKFVFVTATDGNHGRGVSWAGGIFGCGVHVYMPVGSAEVRAQAIRDAGPAEVEITDMSYDDTVRFAERQSREKGWFLIQDTAWEGYEKIPAWIIQGYLTMAAEAMTQSFEKGLRPTHLFLQAGVGAMAGGVLGFFSSCLGENGLIAAVVEPKTVDCIFRSAAAGDGSIHSIGGSPETIMSGLNCGTPCKITWPVLRDYAQFYFACPDCVAAHGMRVYARQPEKVVSGESGAVTMGVLDLLMRESELREVRTAMGLNRDSVILLLNTEGNTDPESYARIVDGDAYRLTEIETGERRA